MCAHERKRERLFEGSGNLDHRQEGIRETSVSLKIGPERGFKEPGVVCLK